MARSTCYISRIKPRCCDVRREAIIINTQHRQHRTHRTSVATDVLLLQPRSAVLLVQGMSCFSTRFCGILQDQMHLASLGACCTHSTGIQPTNLSLSSNCECGIVVVVTVLHQSTTQLAFLNAVSASRRYDGLRPMLHWQPQRHPCFGLRFHAHKQPPMDQHKLQCAILWN